MSSVVEHTFTGLTTPYTSYDSTRTNLGALITQHAGSTATDQWAGPLPLGFLRFREMALDIAPVYPHVISYSSTIDWVFLVENSTASTTRRVALAEYNKTTQTFNWRGYVILNFPVAGNMTAVDLFVTRNLYTTGTASASGTAVTGNGTGWKTARYSIGARIGFGSTDPTQITTWYYITALGSDSSITISASAGTVPDGPFVIEELQALVPTTCSTPANGGLFIAKGLNPDDFCGAGTNIPVATNADNDKKVYYLQDTGILLQIATGIGVDPSGTDTSRFVYALHRPTTTTAQYFKFDIRAALTVSSGTSTSAYICKTAASGTLVTLATLNNTRCGVLNHHPVLGEKCLYFVGTSRIYRVPVNRIYELSTNWIIDVLVETPPGFAVSNIANGSVMVEIDTTIDRLIISRSSSNGYERNWITKYNTEKAQAENMFGIYHGQVDANTVRLDEVAFNAGVAASPSMWSENGICYMCKGGTTGGLLAVPIGAHWDYASGNPVQRLITPALSTPMADSLTRLYVNHVRILGSDKAGSPPEPWRVYVRTSGISDNSGEWIRITAGSLEHVVPSTQIQVMFEFRILGTFCVPARIHSVAITYQKATTDSHYQPSAKFGNKFVWRHATAFGGSVGNLKVRMYNTSDELVVEDYTDAAMGLFERSTDGSNWVTWTNADKSNETTYVRYTPPKSSVNTTVKAFLSLA